MTDSDFNQEPIEGLDAEEVTAAEPARTGSVKWTGGGGNTFEERVITKADWKRAGVDNGRDVVWNYGNKFTVDLGDLDFLDDDKFAELIDGDPDMKVSRS